MLAAGERYDEDNRDIDVERLAADPDPRFRPDPALASQAERLDRPIVPLLNAFARLGCSTFSSCAGHLALAPATLALTDHAPYVDLDASEHSVSIARIAAATFPTWELTFVVRGSAPPERCALRVGSTLGIRPTRPLTVTEHATLDAELLRAAERLWPAAQEHAPLAGGLCAEHRLIARLGGESEGDWLSSLDRVAPGTVRERSAAIPSLSPVPSIREDSAGACEMHLWNYRIAGDAWRALIVSDSFTSLESAIDLALAVAATPS